MSERDCILNLGDWIERRKDSLGGYGDHIVHSVRAYEAEIKRLREDIAWLEVELSDGCGAERSDEE